MDPMDRYTQFLDKLEEDLSKLDLQLVRVKRWEDTIELSMMDTRICVETQITTDSRILIPRLRVMVTSSMLGFSLEETADFNLLPKERGLRELNVALEQAIKPAFASFLES